jgi:chromosome segregation ATPase
MTRLVLPAQWERLEGAAEEASIAVAAWKRRAQSAEQEVARLRGALEELTAERDRPHDLDDEIKRLRAENALLRSRMQQARTRVSGILRRLGTLEVES